jgi:mRNA interferase RelE/StbE
LDVAGAQIEALPRPAREHILDFIYLRLRETSNPRRDGQPLLRELAGFWRYRIDEYRIICTLDDKRLLLTIVRVGHRYDVYGAGLG